MTAPSLDDNVRNFLRTEFHKTTPGQLARIRLRVADVGNAPRVP